MPTNRKQHSAIDRARAAGGLEHQTRLEDVWQPAGGLVDRLAQVITGFRAKHGVWPTKLRLGQDVLNVLKESNLTPLGLTMLQAKLKLEIDNSVHLVTEDEHGRVFDYAVEGWSYAKPPESGEEWVWRCKR